MKTPPFLPSDFLFQAILRSIGTTNYKHLTTMVHTLILVRHGQSDWNEKNLFTGWVDVRLSPTGEKEAHRAGEFLKESGLKPVTPPSYRVLFKLLTLLWMSQIDFGLMLREHGD